MELVLTRLNCKFCLIYFDGIIVYNGKFCDELHTKTGLTMYQ